MPPALEFALWILALVLAPFIYALWFAGREERLRTWALASSRKMVRLPYVLALSSAVRGGAVKATTTYLALLVLAAMYATALVTGSAWLSIREKSLNTRLAIAAARDLTKSPDELQAELKRLREVTIANANESEPLLQAADRDARSLQIITGVVTVLAWLAQMFWLPYTRLRSQFAHDLGRYYRRMQTLVTPEELVGLTTAELAVKDEHTLEFYVKALTDVAKAHNLEGLAARFDLWPRPRR